MGNDNSNNNNYNKNNYNNNNNNGRQQAMQQYKQQQFNGKEHKIQKIIRQYPDITKQEASNMLDNFDGDVDQVLTFCQWYEKDKQDKTRKEKEKREEEERRRLYEQRLRVKQQRRQQEEEEKERRQQIQQLQLQRYNNNNESNNNDDNENNTANEEEQMKAFIQLMASAVLIERAGFDVANQENCENIIAKLKKTACKNRTLLRDGICTGIVHLLKLKAVLTRLETFSQYKFIHIVLTDGEDTGSKTSTSELSQIFEMLNKEIGDACKTYFIGIKLESQGTKEIKQIAQMGGDAAEFFNCNDDVGISSIFQRIQLQLVRRQEVAVIQHDDVAIIAARQNYGLELSVNNYLVLFTLDTSGSMAGGRWNQVVGSVSKFLESLSSRDIFGVLVFNDEIKIITGNEEK